MSTTNYPSASPQSQPPKKDYRGLIIGLLALGLIGTWGYLLWNNNKNEQQHQADATTITKVTDEKSELQRNFDASLARLDSVSGSNNELQGKLTTANSEIAKMKNEIRSILNKRNATAAELSRARDLIAQLNSKIDNLEQEVARLTQENKQLGTDLSTEREKTTKLTTDLVTTSAAREDLAKKVDVASTLNASNINITPIHEKNNGKEKVTTSAKRVDKLLISFDVDNRIAQSGNTDIYVSITGPDGRPISVEALGSGTFDTRDEGSKSYTAKVPLEFEAGKKKNVQFAWKQNSDFQRGDYKIEIYNNGFKIGEGIRTLRKGGLFG